jgi:hypothetical protein
MALRIGNSIDRDVKRRFDVEVGETLGEELSEALKNAVNDDGQYLPGSARITDDVRRKVQRFFDSEFGNGEINTPELAKLLNSDIVKYFKADWESDEGYLHNNDALHSVFHEEFGVKVDPEAKENFIWGVDEGTGEGFFSLWDTSDPPMGMQLVGNRRADLRFSEASIRAAAVLQHYHSSDGWHDADEITREHVNKLIENKYAFEFSSTNRGVLRSFLEEVPAGDAKRRLTQMLRDAAG